MGGSHDGLGNGGCCKLGEPAGVLFDAAARNDQHEQDDRPLREVDRGAAGSGWDEPGSSKGDENAKLCK